MVLIKDTKGRKENETDSGYVRVTGSKPLGQLISKYHATSIRTGNDLEKVLAKKLPPESQVSIDKLNKEKRIFKGAKNGHDAIVDCVLKQNDVYLLIEIKDGDTFDTKKVPGELESLRSAKEFLFRKGISKDKIKTKFCSFNAISHEQIEKGSKGLLDKDMALTGKELCDLLDLDFDEIVEERKEDQKENLKYFISELEKIPEIKGN